MTLLLKVALFKTLQGHSGKVSSVAFDPQGELLASSSNDGSIKFWDVVNWQESANILCKGEGISSLRFSPDGQFLAAINSHFTIQVWEVNTKRLHYTLPPLHRYSVTSLAFSPDGNILASGSHDNTIALWDVHAASLIKIFTSENSYRVNCVSFSPDGRYIASGCEASSSSIVLWDVLEGTIIKTLEVPWAEACDVETKGPITLMYGHIGEVVSLTFSPDGQFLASGGEDETVIIWNINTGQDLLQLTGHLSYQLDFRNTVTSVAFSPDGKILASGSEDKTIKFWDVKTGKLLSNLVLSNRVSSLAFNPDGNLLAGNVDRSIYVWQIGTNETPL